MALSCLLLTSDAALLDVMRTTLDGMGLALELRADSASATELATRRHIDGFVIDCDDVSGATDTLATIRNSRSNKLAIVFAILNGKTNVAAAFEAGANFVLGKPVPNRLLRSHLEIALIRMEREHRRYFRHRVDLSIMLSCSADTLTGKIINVSEGGLAVTHFGPAEIEGAVKIEFELPGTTAQVFRAQAEVAWRDSFAIGLRFLRVETPCRQSLAAWLELLEAQLQFRESTPSSNAELN
jgi:CheY-like chemotaxis protein